MRRVWFSGVLLLLMGGMLAAAPPQDDFKREGSGPQRAAKDALEGKPPPPMQVKGWMNTGGKDLTWEDLRGKVVVIDFWGVW
jgi:hypothetical protein